MSWDNDAIHWLAGGGCSSRKRNGKRGGGNGNEEKERPKPGAYED
jgi:hypothetical protein